MCCSWNQQFFSVDEYLKYGQSSAYSRDNSSFSSDGSKLVPSRCSKLDFFRQTFGPPLRVSMSMAQGPCTSSLGVVFTCRLLGDREVYCDSCLDWLRAGSLAHSSTEEKATLNHKPKSRTFTRRSWQWSSCMLDLLPRNSLLGHVYPRLGEAFAHPCKRGEDVEGASRHCLTVFGRNGKGPGRTGQVDLARLQEKHLHWVREMLPEAIKKACDDAKISPTEVAHVKVASSSGYHCGLNNYRFYALQFDCFRINFKL